MLAPTARSDADQRLYSEQDFARLQQILTLKLIGLSLDDIRRLLTTDPDEIGPLLERQKQALRAQAAQVLRLSDLIERAQVALRTSGQPDLEQTIEIIRAVTMHNEKSWLVQFLSESQQSQLAGQDTPFGDQRAVGVAWQTLFADIHALTDRDPRDPAVQALVDRWDALAAATTNGDDAASAGLTRAYAAFDTQPDLDDAPPEVRAWAQSLRDATAFITRARATRDDTPAD